MADYKTNFPYKRIFGKSLMVVIPHEDDETNVAGATIAGAAKAGVNVYCVYLTNGDRSYRASVRLKEAVDALHVLGVPKQNIIILGYPDGGTKAERNIYSCGKTEPVTVKGRSETYGAAGIEDFSFKKYGCHHAYTWKNLLNDLEAVILTYMPSAIIGTDFDNHPDHRMTALAVQLVMGRILRRKGNNYYPLVLMGFAYATAYESVDDFYSGANLLGSVIDRSHLCYPEDETDNPAYRWTDRVRLPVPDSCRAQLLFKNQIFQALRKHISQRAYTKAKQIINSDQVFWERRTDNLVMKGHISASSGNAEKLNDFLYLGAADIRPRQVIWDHYLWSPAGGDPEKRIIIRWENPVEIEEIDLFGNIDGNSEIEEARVELSNGYTFHTGKLKKRGQKTPYIFDKQKNISWFSITIEKSTGSQPGLSEVEAYRSAQSKLRFVKISVNGIYASPYIWDVNKEKITINAYNYQVNELLWYLDGQEVSLDKLNATINKEQKNCEIMVQSILDSTIYDKCFIEVKKSLIFLEENYLLNGINSALSWNIGDRKPFTDCLKNIRIRNRCRINRTQIDFNLFLL